jgi:hypothetical protein
MSDAGATSDVPDSLWEGELAFGTFLFASQPEP